MLIKELEKILITYPVRGHISPATIGHSCERYIWIHKNYNGSIESSLKENRLSERKILEKTRILTLLPIPNNIHSFYSFSVEAVAQFVAGANIRGYVDAILKDKNGLRYILLIKTSGDKKFKEIKKHGIKKIKFNWWVEAQVFMILSEINSSIILVANKNDESLYEEIVDIIPDVGQDFLKRAVLIDKKKKVPQGIFDLEKTPPDCYECIFHKKCYSKKS